MFEIEFYMFKHRYTKFVCSDEKSALSALKDFRSCGNHLFMHKKIAGSYAIVTFKIPV